MRLNLIIMLDGQPIGKPVKITDTEFKTLRGELLKLGYPLDADKEWNQLLISSKGLSDSMEFTLPSRLKEIINNIKHKSVQKRRKAL